MPFYIRKSVSVGPFRFNLSKSGIGISAGVKGFRIGSGPRGNYINVGRGGLYYRASLNAKARPVGARRKQPLVLREPEPQVELEEIETGELVEMTDSNVRQVADQINEKLRMPRLRLWVFVLGLVAIFEAQKYVQYYWLKLAIVLLAAVSVLLAWYYDRIRRAVVLLYALDTDAAGEFERLTKAFDRICNARGKWVIQAQGRQTDRKHHAGASFEVKRTTASLKYCSPDVVRTNVSIPAIEGGRQNLYFFPDTVLVIEGHKAAAIEYRNIRLAISLVPFIEEKGGPADAKLIRYNWKYINRNGGPDKRFANNRQLPVFLYQELHFESSSGLNKLVQLSLADDRSDFAACLQRLGDFATDKNPARAD